MARLLEMFGLRGKAKGPHTDDALKSVAVADAYALSSRNALMIIDVREASEWNKTGRPQGSVGISLGDPDFEMKLLEAVGGDFEKPIAVSCQAGPRAAKAAKKARAAGHHDVAVIEGCFAAWEQAGLPIDYPPF